MQVAEHLSVRGVLALEQFAKEGPMEVNGNPSGLISSVLFMAGSSGVSDG